MFDLICITLFVLVFSYLHSYYNQRKSSDVYFVFILTEIVMIYSYIHFRGI